jgi:hypothetical protein
VAGGASGSRFSVLTSAETVPIALPMMRAINLPLIVAAVAAVIFGGYWVGHAVWRTGEDNRNRVVGETPRTANTTTARAPTKAEPDRLSEPWVRVVLFASGAIVVVSVIASAIGSVTRRARSGGERWHA